MKKNIQKWALRSTEGYCVVCQTRFRTCLSEDRNLDLIYIWNSCFLKIMRKNEIVMESFKTELLYKKKTFNRLMKTLKHVSPLSPYAGTTLAT